MTTMTQQLYKEANDNNLDLELLVLMYVYHNNMQLAISEAAKLQASHVNDQLDEVKLALIEEMKDNAPNFRAKAVNLVLQDGSPLTSLHHQWAKGSKKGFLFACETE